MASATMTPVTSTALQSFFEEDLYPQVIDTLPEICPVADKLVPTWKNVQRSSGIGRKWTIRHVFSDGLSGHLKWVDDRVDALRQLGDGAGTPASIQYGSVTAKLPTNTWPDATEISMSTAFERDVPMAMAYGNLPMPLEIVQADKLDAAMARVVELNLKGGSKMVALSIANAWFKPATVTGVTAGSGSLAKVGTVNASYDGAAATGSGEVRITALSAGRFRRFMNGQMVDVIKSDGTVKNKVGAVQYPLVVDGVDPLYKTLRLVCPFGALDAGVAADDYIYPYKSTRDGTTGAAWSGPFGLEDHIKATGTMFHDGRTGFGISVDAHTSFKSYIVAHSAVMTEQDLNKYIGHMQSEGSIYLDTIVTTLGVTNKLQELPHSGVQYRQNFDRTAKALEYVAGRATIKYVYEGREFDWFVCSLVESGVMYGLRRSGGNYKQYTPPPVESNDEGPANFASAIEFVGRALGYTGMWCPVMTTSAVLTPMVQAPFMFRTQILPDAPQSFKATGCTESTV